VAIDLTELVELAEGAARQAGTLLHEALREQHKEISTKTSSTDMVSEMDHAAEKLILDRLLGARPDDAVLAEEGGERPGTSGVRWVIDPLDGTTNYLYAHPRYSVSIAAEVDGQVVVGVVADPALGEVFTSVKGGGTRLNGEAVVHSGKEDLATALVATGFSYLGDRRAAQAAVLTHLLPAVRDIRRHGVASLDLCWVACGRVDAYYEVGLQPWDVAAGVLIAAEAGAVVSGVDGGPPSGASVLATAPGIAAELLALLGAAGVAS
jgi:myo-inositol-1(or 4)-monophosphatase